jgi:hypothetical protein
MKQKIIRLLIGFIMIVGNLDAQNPYYDALTISKSLDQQGHFGPRQFPVLRKYYPGKTDNEIAIALASNPFLKDYFDPASTASLLIF